jgi:hypothetical protein
MRAHLKLLTPLGVLGVLAASAAIQIGASGATTAVHPLVGNGVDTAVETIDTITDQVQHLPDEMHW